MKAKKVLESSLFQPKEEHELAENIANKMLELYVDKPACFYIENTPKINFYTGETKMVEAYSKYGRGIYVYLSVPDKEMPTRVKSELEFLFDIFYELNVAFTSLHGFTDTFKILSHDKIKPLLIKIIENLLKREKSVKQTILILRKFN